MQIREVTVGCFLSATIVLVGVLWTLVVKNIELQKNSLLDNEEIQTIEKFLAKQKDSEDLKIELDYVLDVKKYYNQVLLHIEKKILSEEDAVKILQDLEDMRDDEDDI